MKRWVSHTIEQRVLGILALHPDKWDLVQADFDPAWFADPWHRQIAETMCAMALQGERVSPTLLAARLTKSVSGSDKLLDQLIAAADSVISTAELGRLVQALRDNYRKRHAYQQLTAAAQEIASADADTPTAEILERAQTALISAFVNHGKRDIVPWMDVLGDVHREWVDIQEGRAEVAFPLGLTGLTSLLGGLRRKRMYILAGRPSMGKSALAMNIVRAVSGLHGKRSLVCTLEQSASEFAQRAISAAVGLPADRWGRAKWPEADKDLLGDGLTKVATWPIDVVDTYRPSVDKLKMLARVEKARHPDLALIVVDYLQEMDIATGRGQNFATAVGDVASELRALAGELDVALILVSQLSRQVEMRDNKRPQMADIRDSGRLEEVADTILFLYRPGYYNSLGSELLDNVSEISVGKNRQGGGAGKTTLAYFDRAIMRFEDLDDALQTEYLDRLQEVEKRRGRG
mgnify:CR=1 FL=1